MNPMKVSVQVLGTEVVYLDEGHAAEVEFTAFPGRPFTGKIETINPQVDPTTNTARVTVHVDNTDGRIFPGMYAEADLEAQKFPGPSPGAENFHPGGHRRAPVSVRGRERPRQLALRAPRHGERPSRGTPHDPDRARTGVKPGETVLVDGHHYLTHDAAVNVVEDLAAAGGGRPDEAENESAEVEWSGGGCGDVGLGWWAGCWGPGGARGAGGCHRPHAARGAGSVRPSSIPAIVRL